MSHPSSSPQELWSFLLPRCPLRKPLFPYTSLSTSRRPSFQPRALSPIPSTTCQGFRGKRTTFSGPSDWRRLANWRGKKSKGWAGPLRKFLCCLRLLGAAGGGAGLQGLPPVALGREKLLVTGRSPVGETGFGEGKQTRVQEKTAAEIRLLVGVAECELGKSCLCQRKPGPTAVGPLNPPLVHFYIHLWFLNQV